MARRGRRRPRLGLVEGAYAARSDLETRLHSRLLAVAARLGEAELAGEARQGPGASRLPLVRSGLIRLAGIVALRE